MKILAITIQGKEFIYKKASAHAVNDKQAVMIQTALNGIRYQLKVNEVWHIYSAGMYEKEHTGAAINGLHLIKPVS